MSLPFFGNIRSGQSQSVTAKRIRVKGQGQGRTSKGVPVRASFDGKRSGVKRSAAEEFADVWGHEIPHNPQAIGGSLEQHDEPDVEVDDRVKVAVLGLGSVGSPIALALASRPGSYQLQVYDKDPKATHAFSILPGVTVKASATAACAWADVVVVCSTSYGDSEALLAGAPLKGRTILQLSPGAPGEATHAASLAARAGALYLDGCLLGSTEELAAKGSCIAVAGDRAAFKATEALIKFIAPQAFWCGEAVCKAKAVNLALFSFLWGSYAAHVQALAIGQHFGLAHNIIPTLITGGMIPLLKDNIMADAAARAQARADAARTASAWGAQHAAQQGGEETVVMPMESTQLRELVSPQYKEELRRCAAVLKREGMATPFFSALLESFGVAPAGGSAPAHESPALRTSGSSNIRPQVQTSPPQNVHETKVELANSSDRVTGSALYGTLLSGDVIELVNGLNDDFVLDEAMAMAGKELETSSDHDTDMLNWFSGSLAMAPCSP